MEGNNDDSDSVDDAMYGTEIQVTAGMQNDSNLKIEPMINMVNMAGYNEIAGQSPMTNTNIKQEQLNELVQKAVIQSMSSINSNSSPHSMAINDNNDKNNGCYCTYSSIFRVIIFILALYAALLSTYNFMNQSECKCNNTSSTLQTISLSPSISPTISPTILPTNNPSKFPSTKPSTFPSINPTLTPSISPTLQPTDVTMTPSLSPTMEPTFDPIYIEIMDMIRTQNESIQALKTGLNDMESGYNEIPISSILSPAVPSGGSALYTITDYIPAESKKFQFYIQLICGNSNGPDSHLSVTTSIIAHSRTYSHRFIFHPYAQAAYSWNSDNTWFPMPTNGEMNVVTSQSWVNGCVGQMRILRYSV